MKNTNLQIHIQNTEKDYDDKEYLLFSKLKHSYNPVHSKLNRNRYVHPITDSLRFAFDVLKFENCYSKRADDIIRKVTALQQGNSFKEHYGLWPVFLEEPIDKMPVPDKNTAVFNLIPLLQLYSEFRDVLPKDTLKKIEFSCLAASTFIVNRNTTLRYSHIVVQECYACVFCGELLSRPEFVNYGMHKIEKFLNFTLSCGDFFEFNSPNHSLTTAQYLKKILDNIKNTRVISAAQKLNQLLWYSLSAHYHFPTSQLAGPFSRTHADFLDNNEKLIFKNIGKKNAFLPELIKTKIVSVDDIICPPQFYPFFANKKTIEYSQRLIFQGQTFPNFAYSYTATTYSQPEYTLGSFNHFEFWAESRPLIGYFGTENSTYCSKVTCLLNGKEFASSLLHCVQVKNSILAAVNFSTNRGINYLPATNTFNEKINISDLRLRFTIIGNTSALKISQKNNKLYVNYNNLLINFNYNFYKSDIFSPNIELSVDENNLYFDLIFYSGRKKTFNLADSEYTICQFSLLFSKNNETSPPVKNTLYKGILTSVQKFEDYEMRLKTHVKPQDWIYLMINDSQIINGIEIESFARESEESALQYDFIVNSSSEIPISASNKTDDSINSILTKIEGILSLDIDSISNECPKIFNTIKHYEIPLDIAKRFAIRILTNTFDVAKNQSIIFEKTVQNEYSNIYITLSQLNSLEGVEKMITNIIDKIKLEYRLYSENEKRKDFIDSVTHIIDTSFSNSSLSLAYISEQIGLDVAHISKTFHNRTGMTYLQYLTRIRMEHAKKLILEDKLDASSIATQCGYENSSSFLRAFKKYTGNTFGSFKNQQ